MTEDELDTNEIITMKHLQYCNSEELISLFHLKREKNTFLFLNIQSLNAKFVKIHT